MADTSISRELLTLLQRVDTPTVCNAIEVAQGKRGFNAFTRRTMWYSDTSLPAMVGFARTARIAGTEPPNEPPATVRSRRMAYFESMAAGPRPAIAVIEDMDEPHCVGAWWGEVHTTVHKGLGLSGALTNGLMRDLGDLAPGFPVLAGGIGPSHAFVHVREIGTPVSIHGLAVQQGDLVHADRHGAVVVPMDVLPTLGKAVETMFASEQVILGPAREPDFNFEKFREAWAAFEKART